MFPVKLYKATDEPGSETKMNEIHRTCSCQVNRKNVCLTCGVDVPPSDVLKGVPANGGFVVLTPEEIAGIKPASSASLDIETFVPEDSIDPLFVTSSYYLSPDGDVAQRSFATVAAGLRETGTVGQGRFTIYGRESTVTLRAVDNGLVVQLMRSANEVRSQEDLPGYMAPGAVVTVPAEVSIMKQLIQMNAGTFDPTEYKDEYAEDFKALVAAKLSGTAVPPKAATTIPMASTNLMSALKASLASHAPAPKRTPKPTAKALGPKSTKGKSKARMATV